MRLLKISTFITCKVEQGKDGLVYCDKVNGCDNCVLEHLKLIENVKGPNFRVQKSSIDQIIDLKENKK